MEGFINQIPTTPLGWITLLIVTVCASVYLASKIRANDMKILRDTNKDQYDRIVLLESKVKQLESSVVSLQNKNKTLEDLVVVALKEYYFEHPTVAVEVKDAVNLENRS